MCVVDGRCMYHVVDGRCMYHQLMVGACACS